ncbi:BCD family MFS transporter [Hyphomicrobium sp.]|uniref:BCD family MFS transporter n=1 Tax=Hyphomicrobium sp. TaxID=82 RepID=UPI000FA295C7|nr:BCD family MFS transporter [Hyphomicrobium sp.]RUP00557.1 MAG: MFS transporter [Hyphomicrobium sp.]
MSAPYLSWFQIVRLGLVQSAIGSIVVLSTSTMNRVMVVELALPAVVPGALVGLHYAVQLLRPYWGHSSDVSRRRTPWIIGGMTMLALGALLASLSILLLSSSTTAGLLLAVVAFTMIGLGVGAAGTSLLALLAAKAGEDKRSGAATLVWLMMIAGIAITAISVGKVLDPYSAQRLVVVTLIVGAIAVGLASVALWGLETQNSDNAPVRDLARQTPVGFKAAVLDVWSDGPARRLTIFVFVSMLAYNAQDLILEPFSGSVFGYTPGQSTELSGIQHGGVFAGMLLIGFLGMKVRSIPLATWAVLGCIASSVALLGLSVAAFRGESWPMSLNVWALGFSNGAFAVATIGTMMALAKAGRHKSEGVRMGVWGAAQGLAFGIGGFLGTVIVDVARLMSGSVEFSYASAFCLEALLFLGASLLVVGMPRGDDRAASHWRAPATLANGEPVKG